MQLQLSKIWCTWYSRSSLKFLKLYFYFILITQCNKIECCLRMVFPHKSFELNDCLYLNLFLFNKSFINADVVLCNACAYHINVIIFFFRCFTYATCQVLSFPWCFFFNFWARISLSFYAFYLIISSFKFIWFQVFVFRFSFFTGFR